MPELRTEQQIKLERFARQWHQWYVEEGLTLRCCKSKFDCLFTILKFHEGGPGYHATEEDWRECRRGWAARWQLRRNNRTLPAELAMKELWYKYDQILESISDTHASIQEKSVISPRQAQLGRSIENSTGSGIELEEEGKRREILNKIDEELSDWGLTIQSKSVRVDQPQKTDRVMTNSLEGIRCPTQTNTGPIQIEVDQSYQEPYVNGQESWDGDSRALAAPIQIKTPPGCLSSQDVGSALAGKETMAHTMCTTDDIGYMLDVIRSRPFKCTEGTYEGRSNASSVYRAARLRRSSHQHKGNVLPESNVSEPVQCLNGFAEREFQVEGRTQIAASKCASSVGVAPEYLWPTPPSPSTDTNEIISTSGGFSPVSMPQSNSLGPQVSYYLDHLYKPHHVKSEELASANPDCVVE